MSGVLTARAGIGDPCVRVHFIWQAAGVRRRGDPAPKPSRRSFSAEYKLAIVAEYENAPNGEKGAILRREGLYSSHVIEWTRARDAGRSGRV